MRSRGGSSRPALAAALPGGLGFPGSVADLSTERAVDLSAERVVDLPAASSPGEKPVTRPTKNALKIGKKCLPKLVTFSPVLAPVMPGSQFEHKSSMKS